MQILHSSLGDSFRATYDNCGKIKKMPVWEHWECRYCAWACRPTPHPRSLPEGVPRSQTLPHSRSRSLSHVTMQHMQLWIRVCARVAFLETLACYYGHLLPYEIACFVDTCENIRETDKIERGRDRERWHCWQALIQFDYCCLWMCVATIYSVRSCEV